MYHITRSDTQRTRTKLLADIYECTPNSRLFHPRLKMTKMSFRPSYQYSDSHSNSLLNNFADIFNVDIINSAKL